MRAFRGSPRGNRQACVSLPLHRSTSCPAQLCNCNLWNSSTTSSSSSSTAQPLFSISCAGSLSSVQGSLPKLRLSCSLTTAQSAEVEDTEETEARSADYSETMNQQMGSYLTYRHEDGINYADIMDGVMVGSCLQTPADVDRLAEQEQVGAIVNLQEDSDMAYFDLDVAPIRARCAERGDVAHLRYPIRDFDAFDLRMKLAGAVQLVADQAKALRGTGKKVYIHCTAGLGRAPATALAYMFWCRGFALNDAITLLKASRACNPRIVAIRQATADLLVDSRSLTPVRIAVHRPFLATSLQIAGLDVGWGQRIDMEWDAATKRHVVTRSLPPGRYPYKFVMDGRWSYSADHPTFTEGEHTNNYVEVEGSSRDPIDVAARERMLADDCCITDEERGQIEAHFGIGS